MTCGKILFDKEKSINEESNGELTTKIDELISIIKGKEQSQVNATVEDVVFIARNPYNPT
jgi:ABC-type enterochelin transport system ATPase subunit